MTLMTVDFNQFLNVPLFLVKYAKADIWPVLPLELLPSNDVVVGGSDIRAIGLQKVELIPTLTC